MECCIMVKLNNQNKEGKYIVDKSLNSMQLSKFSPSSGLSAHTNVISSTSEEIHIIVVISV